jgi:hypothetical protein
MKREFALSAALLCIVLTWACAGSSPSSAVKAFYEAVSNGKTEDAMSLLSQQTINTIGEAKLRAGIQEASRKMATRGGLKDLVITSEQLQGDVATITALLKYGNGTEETEKEQLVKEKGGWRLQPAKIRG